ncbi:MAG TPA: DUF1295 domain-containing protein [Acidimicrobiales bacterium]|nr:DUF1295 domain-containing protein [Acidimicrobiales bacterium]HJM28185.1 DUF1295 domain-containing protein [Acidimicrobiales bacterium]HJM97407.1 DUF1295 domain-containing protein [Acidimicrobiales bacterium]
MSKRLQVGVTSLALSTSVGMLLTLALSSGSTEIGALPTFVVCAIISYGLNYVAFIPSYLGRTEHYFDLTGSITTVTLIVFVLATSNNPDARSFSVAIMVLIWAVRLGSFLFLRAQETGGDSRFEKVKRYPLSFLSWWSLQALWVLTNLACALTILTNRDSKPFGIFAVIGTTLWVLGFAIEVVADQQKKKFRRNPINSEKFINSGLWAWSRHPNYFGEIILWIGIAVIALPVLSGWRWVALISPIFVIMLLTRISGIPILERRAETQWGDEDDYKTYVDETPMLLPRPPKAKLK